MVIEAVASVLNQTYDRLECIVVDDGSAEAADLAQFSGDSRLLCIEGPARGVSYARNRGIEKARGEYVAFLDSDDLWHREKLARQVQKMSSDPSAGLCYTDEIWLRNDKWLNQRHRHRKYSGWIFPFCLPLCIVSFSSAMISRHVLEEIGMLNERLPVCEDYEYWIRLTLHYPTIFLVQRLVTKRGGHDGQLSTRYWGIDRFRVEALMGILAGEQLTPFQSELVAREIRKKCSILAAGARKRGREARAAHYERTAQWAESNAGIC